jgi:hypothetical protein
VTQQIFVLKNILLDFYPADTRAQKSRMEQPEVRASSAVKNKKIYLKLV